MKLWKRINIHLLIGFVILYGCTRPGSQDLPGANTDPFAGLPLLETEILLDINDQNSEGNGQFYFQSQYFQDVVISKNGNIFAANIRGTDIQQFDSDGKFVANIGKEGPGPGEFQSIPFFDILHQDTLFALNQVSWIVNMFVRSGEEWRYANSFNLEQNPSLMPGGIHQLNEHQLAIEYVPNSRVITTSDNRGRLKKTVSLVSFDGTSMSDSLLVVPKNQQTVYTGRSGSSALHHVPFGAKSIINAGPQNSLYHLVTDNFLISIYDNTGQLKDSVKHANFSIGIEEDEKQGIVEENIGVIMPSGQENKEMREQMFKDMPDVVSPLENIFVDRDSGHIIAKRSEKFGGPNWLLLNPDGSRLGVFNLDENFRVFDFRNGKIAGSIMGEEDDALPAIRVVWLPEAVI